MFIDWKTYRDTNIPKVIYIFSAVCIKIPGMCFEKKKKSLSTHTHIYLTALGLSYVMSDLPLRHMEVVLWFAV